MVVAAIIGIAEDDKERCACRRVVRPENPVQSRLAVDEPRDGRVSWVYNSGRNSSRKLERQRNPSTGQERLGMSRVSPLFSMRRKPPGENEAARV